MNPISTDPVSSFNPWNAAFTVNPVDVYNATGLTEMRRIAKAQSEKPAPKTAKAPAHHFYARLPPFVRIDPYPYTYQAEQVKVKISAYGFRDAGWFVGHRLMTYRGLTPSFAVLEMETQAIGLPPSHIETVLVFKRGRWYTVQDKG